MNRVATATISVTPAGCQSVGEKKYTTAGTLVNPSAIQPLQPPLRRGRALKWALTGAFDLGQLAPFSNDAPQDLNTYGSRHHVLQPPIADGTMYIPHTYQPLQQNLDRAVKPSMPGSASTARNMSSLGLTATPSTPGLVPHAPLDRTTLTPHSAPGAFEKPGADDVGSKSLDQLPVKALFNLMRYPNPNQEQARKRWEAAKGGNNAPTPTLRPPHLQSTQTSTPPVPALAPPFGPTSVDYHQNDINVNDANARIFSFQRPNRPTANKYHAATSLNRANPRSFASHWPIPTTFVGAPAPLTAGPPGQRRYQPAIHKFANYSTKSDPELVDMTTQNVGTPSVQGAMGGLVLAPPARRRHPDLVAGLEEAMANVREMHASDDIVEGQPLQVRISQETIATDGIDVATASAHDNHNGDGHASLAESHRVSKTASERVGVNVRPIRVQETGNSLLGSVVSREPVTIYVCDCNYLPSVHDRDLCKHARTDVNFQKRISKPGENQDSGASDALIQIAPHMAAQYQPFLNSFYAGQKEALTAMANTAVARHVPIDKSIKPLMLEAAKNVERYMDSGLYQAGLKQHKLAMDAFSRSQPKVPKKFL